MEIGVGSRSFGTRDFWSKKQKLFYLSLKLVVFQKFTATLIIPQFHLPLRFVTSLTFSVLVARFLLLDFDLGSWDLVLIHVWCLNLVVAIDFYLGSQISFLRFCDYWFCVMLWIWGLDFFCELSFNYKERI